MLRSWSGQYIGHLRSLSGSNIAESGLMYFCMDNMLAIRSIVNTLRIPSLETRVRCAILLDGLCIQLFFNAGNCARYVL